MKSHSSAYYEKRNTQILLKSKTHTLDDLAAQFALSKVRIDEIIKTHKPDPKLSDYERWRAQKLAARSGAYFDSQNVLEDNHALFFVYTKPDKQTGCWNWQGLLDNNNYGYAMVGGKRIPAHRIAAYLGGILPSLVSPKQQDNPLYVLHQCDNPRCCNPAHLLAGTHAMNMGQMNNKGRIFDQVMSLLEAAYRSRRFVLPKTE